MTISDMLPYEGMSQMYPLLHLSDSSEFKCTDFSVTCVGHLTFKNNSIFCSFEWKGSVISILNTCVLIRSPYVSNSLKYAMSKNKPH
jgi:hypothetical protein